MLIVCYGITKSGSTLTFELIKGMLNSAGKKQVRLRDGLVLPGHSINFVERFDPQQLNDLLEATADTAISVKTHADLNVATFLRFEDLQARRQVQIVASYRDPRDIALSLVDAGEDARKRRRREFAEYSDLASTYTRLEKQIGIFHKWASIRGTLRMNYDTVAFSPDTAIDILEKSMGISCNREAAKKYAYEVAFTQKNKGLKDRRLTELTKEQDEEMVRKFSTFINRVVRNPDETLFATFRAKFLAGASADQRLVQ